MSRTFLTVGSLLTLATVALWLAGALHWVQAGDADLWSGYALNAALLMIAAGVIARALKPVSSAITQGRCAVCGHRTERGHMYCLDHLMETVHVTRDKTRGGSPPSSRPRPIPPSKA